MTHHENNWNESPLFSILVPTYNRDTYLPRCIESVLNEPENDIEIIVSDNASTDNTSNVAQKYLHDKRFKYYRNTENIGCARNLYEIAKKASGKYLFILTDDDYILPGSFLKLKNILNAHPNIGYIFGRKYTLDDRDQSISIEPDSIYGKDTLIPKGIEHIATCAHWANIFTGVVFKSSAINWQYWEKHANIAYPTIMLAGLMMPENESYYLEPHVVVHTWHNKIHWDEFGSTGVQIVLKIHDDYLKTIDYILHDISNPLAIKKIKFQWYQKSFSLPAWAVFNLTGYKFRTKDFMNIYVSVAMQLRGALVLQLIWACKWLKILLKYYYKKLRI